MQLLSLAELEREQRVLLLDLEFTCWEDSLNTGWSDPARPPEVIEIGIVAYGTIGGTVFNEYVSFVKPTINSQLSNYCKTLLGIAQDQVDMAQPLTTVVGDIERWLRHNGAERAPTCSWGVNDRKFKANNCLLVGCPDPFSERAHADLKMMIHEAFGSLAVGLQDRDRTRQLLGIPENPMRHRAIGDARELIAFFHCLRYEVGQVKHDSIAQEGRSISA